MTDRIPRRIPDTDTHSFVLRARREGPVARGQAPEGRMHLRIEHVNTATISQHDTLEGALDWLRQRLGRTLGVPAAQARPDPTPPAPEGES